MIFSKSFGYAVRGVLYIALLQDTKKHVQAEEIAVTLGVPRHFVSKILKKLVKAGILGSSKGKSGGFNVNEGTRQTLLIRLFEITDGLGVLDKCTLRLQECSSENPCPLHQEMEHVKQQLKTTLVGISIGDLLKEDRQDFIQSIATNKSE